MTQTVARPSPYSTPLPAFLFSDGSHRPGAILRTHFSQIPQIHFPDFLGALPGTLAPPINFSPATRLSVSRFFSGPFRTFRIYYINIDVNLPEVSAAMSPDEFPHYVYLYLGYYWDPGWYTSVRDFLGVNVDSDRYGDFVEWCNDNLGYVPGVRNIVTPDMTPADLCEQELLFRTPADETLFRLCWYGHPESLTE